MDTVQSESANSANLENPEHLAHQIEKEVTIQYFAYLREHVGKETETLRGTWNTPKEVYLELEKQYQWKVPTSHKNQESLFTEYMRVAINDAFVSWEHELRTGDKLVFMTPVAGG
jgi:molybdopterin synthase sulfur carrier subunit